MIYWIIELSINYKSRKQQSNRRKDKSKYNRIEKLFQSAHWPAIASEQRNGEEIRRWRQTTTTEKKARTALTGSSYRPTGYNRYEVISRRVLGMKARIMRDRGFIGECADRGGPASVFQMITGHHRILASRRRPTDNDDNKQ